MLIAADFLTYMGFSPRKVLGCLWWEAYTQTPQARGNWGRMQSPQNQAKFGRKFGSGLFLQLKSLENILAIFEAVLKI